MGLVDVLIAGILLGSAPAETGSGHFGQFLVQRRDLEDPHGVAVGRNGIVYVVERGAHQVRGMSAQGMHWRSFGSKGHGPGELFFPQGIDVAPDGMVYVADSGNRRVQWFGSTGEFRGQWNRGETTELLGPHDVAAGNQRVFVADRGRGEVLVVSRKGVLETSFHSPFQEQDWPGRITLDQEGRLVVSSVQRHELQVFDASGELVEVLGAPGEYPGLFAAPGGAEWSGDSLFVADTHNHRIQELAVDGSFVHQFGIHDGARHLGEGRLHAPVDVAVAPHGQFLALVEPSENRCQVFLRTKTPVARPPFTTTGPSDHFASRFAVSENLVALIDAETRQVLLWQTQDDGYRPAGTFGAQGSRFGQLQRPVDLCFETRSTLLVADAATRRITRFEVQPGSFPAGRFQKALDLAAVARLESNLADIVPAALCCGEQGTLWIADALHQKLFQFDSGWRLERTLAFPPGAGRFGMPSGLRWDFAAGRLLFVDAYRAAVFAWHGTGDWRNVLVGSESPIELSEPHGIALAQDGSFYLADRGKHVVLHLAADGTLRRRLGRMGYRLGSFLKPSDVEIGPGGSLLVLDFGNHRCQILDSSGAGQWTQFPGSRDTTLTNTPASTKAER